MARVTELRRRIRDAGHTVSDGDLRNWWSEARVEFARVRLSGDLLTAAFFNGRKPKDRETKRIEYAGAIFEGEVERYRGWIDQRRGEEPPLAPFHWEIEFPEVFDRDSSAGRKASEPAPGFDAVVGNPPFAGKNSVAAGNVAGYPDWLKQAHAESHGNADLVAHFFRRAFDVVRDRGVFGLIATNTIAQGDTRASGLRWICKQGGEIFSVRRRVKWPGLAAVVVSVLHIGKGAVADHKQIDGRDVERITAFLFHRGGHEDPVRLAANAGKSFVGSYVLGMGFTFDDTDLKGVASPLAEMRRLIQQNPRNQEVILPYIGGQEVNTSPTHAHHRYVINFRDWPLRRDDLGEAWMGTDDDRRRAWLRTGIVPLDYPGPVAADWPELLAIVEERVKPERDKVNRKVRRDYWWRFGDRQPALFRSIAGLERVLAISRVGQQAALAFLPAGMVYAESTIVFPFSDHTALCVLQSRPHEIWARFFGSSLEDRLRYTPSDCFETFPFPRDWGTDPALEDAGQAYYEFRASLMVRNGEGLTKTYNRFHDPYENDPEIARLRELHAVMDRAVLAAYGWADLPIYCEFLLDYETGAEETGSSRKKPYRCRWPDEISEEILARLLELNVQRAAEEDYDGRGARATAGKRSPV